MANPSLQDRGSEILKGFRPGEYAFGVDVADRAGDFVGQLGRRIVVFAGKTARSSGLLERVSDAVRGTGGEMTAVLDAARPNAPVEDVHAMARGLHEAGDIDCALTIGGGSAIDAAKAAVALHALGGELDPLYGMGTVTEALDKQNASLLPTIAFMTAASSAAHLTRYSNVTDFSKGQKKLLIDDALVPTRAVFDYGVTRGMSAAFTRDGAFDGISHSLEVYLGATGSPKYDRIEQVALTGIELIITSLDKAVDDPDDVQARTALGLGTDLGGVAIMTGGTSGAHLNSFSLVDLLPHGRAVAILNPYYVVFFAPACEPQLRQLGELFRRAGLMDKDTSALGGRELGLAVSEAMLALAETVGFPTRLGDVEGFGEQHVQRCLDAAKTPQLRSKLENMPVPMTPETVDEYMGSVLEAAAKGEPERVKNMR